MGMEEEDGGTVVGEGGCWRSGQTKWCDDVTAAPTNPQRRKEAASRVRKNGEEAQAKLGRCGDGPPGVGEGERAMVGAGRQALSSAALCGGGRGSLAVGKE